ncbi:helix-turn-helix domain-containing protein [Leptolyngbya sp. NIES-2104]|uniref:helix-turn-helix domain-containing protein n=1 Tax=Leptolyngbya sp. NIES-2104 TaxID=1552121 RepID=UPI0006EC86BA|nr:AraC family transcriptional regulator [Leptolyngbya sp. NIES-2104]GAQ00004.1 transcriptional regulator, AraC family [Leptolyngbya sp. NIES-2104]
MRFAQTAEESFGVKSVELRQQFAMTDPLIHQIRIALRASLQQDKHESRLYAETMANALIVHLLQRYTAQQAITLISLGGLSHYKQRQVIDYIQAHLEKNLGLEELATLVQLSSHHFCECFKHSIGMSPRQFVIHCRIERAKELLLQRKQSIAEIAQTVGFLDQSHLHRHFKRLVGVTPRQFQQGASIN